jgi:hypothetical protein
LKEQVAARYVNDDTENEATRDDAKIYFRKFSIVNSNHREIEGHYDNQGAKHEVSSVVGVDLAVLKVIEVVEEDPHFWGFPPCLKKSVKFCRPFQ